MNLQTIRTRLTELGLLARDLDYHLESSQTLATEALQSLWIMARGLTPGSPLKLRNRLREAKERLPELEQFWPDTVRDVPDFWAEALREVAELAIVDALAQRVPAASAESIIEHLALFMTATGADSGALENQRQAATSTARAMALEPFVTVILREDAWTKLHNLATLTAAIHAWSQLRKEGGRASVKTPDAL
jgi:hypothetical protein